MDALNNIDVAKAVADAIAAEAKLAELQQAIDTAEAVVKALNAEYRELGNRTSGVRWALRELKDSGYAR